MKFARWNVKAAGFAVLLAAHLTMANAVAPSINWGQFGEEAMKAAPEKIQKGPEAERARYLAGKVAEEMDRAGIKPNGSLPGRLKAGLKYGRGATDTGACGPTTEALHDAFVGAGFPIDRMLRIQADKPDPGVLSRASPPYHAWKVWNFYGDVNRDHGALGLVIGGKVWVVDGWEHGVNTGQFKGLEKKPEALMPLPAWGKMAQAQGYVSFSAIESSAGKAGPRYSDINKLGEALELTDRSGTAGKTGGGNKAPAPVLSASSVGDVEPVWKPYRRHGRAGAPETAGAPPNSSAAASTPEAPVRGVVLWPKLQSSAWKGTAIVEMRDEDGSATLNLRMEMAVDKANGITGIFEFPLAHTPEGPVTAKVPLKGSYDPGTGKFVMTFHAETDWTDKTATLPIKVKATVDGTLKGSVEADPSKQDLAQGTFAGARVSSGSAPSAKAVRTEQGLKGSWRLQRNI